ncbi:MAG: nucleotide exchange factor GrpE [Planctomycetota bacterium]
MATEPATNDNDPEEGGLDETVGGDQTVGGQEPPRIILPDDELGDLESQLAEERERALRLRAEMENLRSRTARELREERTYAAMPIVRDLLPVVDNIDRAIEAAEKDSKATGDEGGLLEGFRLVRQQLLTVLQTHQCQPIEAVGESFDPQVHEAILQQPSEESPAGTVILQTQTGYLLHERVVRPSQVIVSSGPASAAE